MKWERKSETKEGVKWGKGRDKVGHKNGLSWDRDRLLGQLGQDGDVD